MIVNNALSLKALAVLRTKGVNQQQSHGQGRSVPVQLGAEGCDIIHSNTIPRQSCCEQWQSEGVWSNLQISRLFPLISSNNDNNNKKKKKISSSSTKCLLCSYAQCLPPRFHAEQHLENSQTNELSLLSCLICWMSVSVASHVYQSPLNASIMKSSQTVGLWVCRCHWRKSEFFTLAFWTKMTLQGWRLWNDFTMLLST